MVRIPEEYQEVEYIESTGTQYINLEKKPSKDAILTVEFYSKKTVGQSFQSIAGCQNVIGVTPGSAITTQRRFGGIITSNNLNFRAAIVPPSNGSDIDVVLPNANYINTKRTYVIDCKNNLASVDNYTVSLENSTETQSHNLYILARNDRGTASAFAVGKLYRVKYEDNDFVADMYPAIRKSDNEPGMYDTVSGTFYINSGTGEFLIGNPVSYDTTNLLESRRRILLNTPHLESLTGTQLQFTTDMASKLKECRIHFTPIQEGSGDPSPDNVRPIHGCDGVTVYHNNNSLTIPFPQTIYGGYVDLVKGEVVEEIDSEGQQITPNTYSITPQTIRTLKGLNSIWSDANGNIELKFWTH